MTLRGVAAVAGLALSFALHAAEPDYSFDASEFEKKPFELGGYLELKAERFELNRGGAFYELSEAGRQGRGRLERATATLKLTGKARAGDWLVTTRTNSEATDDQIASDSSSRFDELLVSWKPNASFTLDAGKTVVKWGKGYAWNPVGFIERQRIRATRSWGGKASRCSRRTSYEPFRAKGCKRWRSRRCACRSQAASTTTSAVPLPAERSVPAVCRRRAQLHALFRCGSRRWCDQDGEGQLGTGAPRRCRSIPTSTPAATRLPSWNSIRGW